MTLMNDWMPTGQATKMLGVSADTLKRYADRHFFLVEGKHWRLGPHKNSPRLWNVSACIEALSYRGRINRQEQAESKSIDKAATASNFQQ